MSDVPRVELQKLLEPLVPAGWQVVTSERAIDQHGTVLYLKQQTVERHPKAGRGVHLVTFTATITVDGQDIEKAEDRLDDELTVLVQALDDAGIPWDKFTKALYDGALGYQANIELTTQKEL